MVAARQQEIHAERERKLEGGPAATAESAPASRVMSEGPIRQAVDVDTFRLADQPGAIRKRYAVNGR